MDSLLPSWPTPTALVLGKVRAQTGARICALLGQLTPGGTSFDALAAHAVLRLRSKLVPGATVVTAALADFGPAVCLAVATLEVKRVVVTPESVSLERRELLRHAGARVEAVPAGTALPALWRRARGVARGIPGAVLVRPTRGDATETLGRALSGIPGPVNAFVCGAGSGLTFVAGCAAFRARGAKAVLLHAGGPHHVQGFATLETVGRSARQHADEVLKVDEAVAWKMRERLAHEEGLFVSLSSAANIAGALAVAENAGPDARVVTVVWSSGERDFSLGSYFK